MECHLAPESEKQKGTAALTGTRRASAMQTLTVKLGLSLTWALSITSSWAQLWVQPGVPSKNLGSRSQRSISPWTSPSHSAPSPESIGHFFLSSHLLELKHPLSPFLSVHHHFLNVEPHWHVLLFFVLWPMLPRIEVILFSLFSGSPGLSSGILEMPAKMDRRSLTLTISHQEDGNSHRSSLTDKHQQGLPPYNMLITTKTWLEQATQSLKIEYKWTTYGRQDFALGLSAEHSCYLHK